MENTRMYRRKMRRKRRRRFLTFSFFLLVILIITGTIIMDKFNSKEVVAEDALQLPNRSEINQILIKEELKVAMETGTHDTLPQKPMEVIEDEEKDTKIAYLTFDDGPSSNITPQILDILDEYDVKATFFVIGYLAEKNPELIIREYDSGHTIGNHTYSHNYKYVYRSVNDFFVEIDKNEKVLKNILGKDFQGNLIRFPGGSFGEKRRPYRQALEKKGIQYVDWNALNGDAEGHNISKVKLVERLKNTTKGKNKVIILMHDAGAKKTTVEALPEIIEYLKNEGYEFRAINKEDTNEK